MLTRLKTILAIQSESFGQWRMFAFIIRQLTAMAKDNVEFFVNEGNIYAWRGKGENCPAIVAHMDTVHKVGKDLTVIEGNGCLTGMDMTTMRQSGIGGDDKVGIYIALEVLRKFDNVQAVFFRDEEVGCVGSGKADHGFFKTTTFVLQCDRNGKGDFITNASGTELSSKAFRRAIGPIMKPYGYKFERGMMTDVMMLKDDGLNISCANMSCGYYRPHSDTEYVKIADVMNTKKFVFEVIEKIGSTHFPHTASKKQWHYGGGITTGYYGGKDDWMNDGRGWGSTKGKQWDEPSKVKGPYVYKPTAPSLTPCDGCDNPVPKVSHSSDLNLWLCETCYNLFGAKADEWKQRAIDAKYLGTRQQIPLPSTEGWPFRTNEEEEEDDYSDFRTLKEEERSTKALPPHDDTPSDPLGPVSGG